jgi:ribonuclease BN (tRNA processing enzyme)
MSSWGWRRQISGHVLLLPADRTDRGCSQNRSPLGKLARDVGPSWRCRTEKTWSTGPHDAFACDQGPTGDARERPRSTRVDCDASVTPVSALCVGNSAVAFTAETTCFLLKIGSYSLLVDAGTNPARSLHELNISTTDIDGVFLSHVHADHMQGLPSFVFTRAVQARSATAPVAALSLIAGDPVLEGARHALDTFYPDREFELDWQTELDIEIPEGRLRLKPFPVIHTVPCFGFEAVLNDRLVAGFTADTEPFSDLADHLDNVPVLIVECFGTEGQFGDLIRSAKHLSAESANALVREVGPRVAVPFHMHVPYQREGEAVETLHAVLADKVPDGVWRFLKPGESLEIDI